MFGVDLSVLTVRGLSVLYNTLDEHMKKTTGTWDWPVPNTPASSSIWRFLLAISSELEAREYEEVAY